MIANRRPLVFALEEVVPVVLGFLPRDEFPEGGNVQDNAIVEIRFEVEIRRPTQLVLEVPQFREEVFLSFKFLVEPLGFLTRIARCGLLFPQSFQAGGLQPNLRFDVVHQGLEEQVFVETVVI